jgi:hypothetical protein
MFSKINNLFLCAVLLLFNSLAQGQVNCSCALLRAIFEQKEVLDQHRLNQFEEESLVLIDTSGYFMPCTDSLNLKIANVQIVKNAENATKSGLVQMYVYERKGKGDRIHVLLWNKENNQHSTLIFKFRRQKQTFILKHFEQGQF